MRVLLILRQSIFPGLMTSEMINLVGSFKTATVRAHLGCSGGLVSFGAQVVSRECHAKMEKRKMTGEGRLKTHQGLVPDFRRIE